MHRTSVWDHATSSHARESGSTSSPARPLSAWWLITVAAAWWTVLYRQLAETDFLASPEVDRLPAAPHVLMAVTVLGRFCSLAFETLFYRVWWRSWGAPFRFVRFYVWIALCSLIDAWAETVRLLARGNGIESWLTPLLGMRMLDTPAGGSGAALAIVFGSFGALAAARLVLTAHGQARETGSGLGPALALTGVAWILTRIVTWWAIDLMRGMSPVG